MKIIGIDNMNSFMLQYRWICPMPYLDLDLDLNLVEWTVEMKESDCLSQVSQFEVGGEGGNPLSCDFNKIIVIIRYNQNLNDRLYSHTITLHYFLHYI